MSKGGIMSPFEKERVGLKPTHAYGSMGLKPTLAYGSMGLKPTLEGQGWVLTPYLRGKESDENQGIQISRGPMQV